MTRPNLAGLFNGSAAPQPQLTWLSGQPDAPQPPPAEPAARPTTRQPDAEPVTAASIGLFDPVALAERYFAFLQALLDLQRDFGLRAAQHVAELPGMDRLRH